MSIVLEVFAELWSMFVGDRRLTLLALIVVGLAAAAAAFLTAAPIAAPLILLVGALAVLTDAVFAAARKARR